MYDMNLSLSSLHNKKTRYGRELAVCYNKRGEDLNAKMVKEVR